MQHATKRRRTAALQDAGALAMWPQIMWAQLSLGEKKALDFAGVRRMLHSQVKVMQNIPFLKHKLVLLALAALIVFFVLCLPRYFHEMGSKDWPATEGVIMETNLVHAYGAKGMDGYVPELEYRYMVGVHVYVGTRIDFHTQDHIYAPDYAESWLRKYPPGRKVTVYYDPTDASISMLEPGIKPEQNVIFYLGVGYIVAMSLAFLIVFYDYNKVRKAKPGIDWQRILKPKR